MKEGYVYMDCTVRMSNRAMADLLYATIMTKAGLPTTWCMSYEYDKKQNSYNNAWVKVHIHPDQIEKFEELSGLKLETPQVISGFTGR